MIHLFSQIYISADVFGLFNNKSEKRLYITDREYTVPMTADTHLQKKFGIMGIFTELPEVDEEYGSREKLWEALISEKTGVDIIVNSSAAAELLTQYLKSMLAQPTMESVYTLYALSMNNDNRLAVIEAIERTLPDNEPKDDYRVIPLLTMDEFSELYDRVEVIDAIKKIPKKELSFEYLLCNYLIDETNSVYSEALFEKISKIVRRIYTENFVDMAISIHRRFCSFNRPEYDGFEQTLNPYDHMRKIPELQWVFSKNIRSRDVAAVSREFGIRGMIAIYRKVRELEIFPNNAKNERLVHLGELLESHMYSQIVEEDIDASKNNSIFSDTRFTQKVNPLLLTYFYHHKRKNNVWELQRFTID